MRQLSQHLGRDLLAGVVVFLVALPLCIGIATASGAPPIAGLVAGILGGIVVGALSGSKLSVSGPAAGLAVIVARSIEGLGFEAFLLAVVLAGGLQVALGSLKAGGLAHFFPSAVIKGMLAAIGVTLVLKQIPHAVGYDADYEGDESFTQPDGDTTFTALIHSFEALTPAAALVTLASGVAFFLWPVAQRLRGLKLIPTPLMVVVAGSCAAALLATWGSGITLGVEHFVALPPFHALDNVQNALVSPDFTRITDPAVWKCAVTLAIVASIETLLSLEAVDRLDPSHHISPPNRELVAQGVGNALSGLVGGLPVTSVIVRSSANVHAGGVTKLAAISHGIFLLIGVVLLTPLLTQIPLAALAVVLIGVGAKLASPKLFREMARLGPRQLVPFVVTLVAVVTTDLLMGTLIGLVVGLGFVIHDNQHHSVQVVKEGDAYLIRFTKDMSFLSKMVLKNALYSIPDDAHVIIDGTRPVFIDADIDEVLSDFEADAKERGVKVERRLTLSASNPQFRLERPQ